MAHRLILETALKQVAALGFRALTVDVVAAAAGVGKTTIYRRWPNKAAMVMDAFLTLVGPATGFPARPRALDSLKLQMRLQGKFFRSDTGKIIKSLLGEAQFDAELAHEFRERWILPRRRMTQEVLKKAIAQGDLKPDVDLESLVDLLYGPIYYRMQIETGPITDRFTDGVLNKVLEGVLMRR
jgi:AcrR family transcriptional regulator